MSIEAKEALSRRALASGWWRWIAGMTAWDKTESGEGVDEIYVVTSVSGDWLSLVNEWGDTHDADTRDEWPLPNFADGSTLGCIENQLLPEAYGREVSLVYYFRSWKLVFHDDSETMRSLAGNPKTKAEALIVALESAPAKAVKS
jgi:hypothetical protein